MKNGPKSSVSLLPPICDSFLCSSTALHIVTGLLQSPTPLTRLTLSTDILNKLYTKLEVTSRIAHAVDESLSKQQKEFFLRQQMRAIEKELRDLQQQNQTSQSPAGSDPSRDGQKSELDLDQAPDAEDAELMEIKRKIEAMEPGSEERKGWSLGLIPCSYHLIYLFLQLEYVNGDDIVD